MGDLHKFSILVVGEKFRDVPRSLSQKDLGAFCPQLETKYWFLLTQQKIWINNSIILPQVPVDTIYQNRLV